MGAHDTQKYLPRVGDTWVANISIVTIDKFDYWLIDIIDLHSYFILSTIFSEDLNVKDFCSAMELAQTRADKKPKGLLVIGNLNGIDRNQFDQDFFSKGKLLVSFSPENSDEYSEKIRYSYLTRNKILSKLKSKRYVNVLIDGWEVHYNFHRIHELLGNQTPAEKAGINYEFQERYYHSLEHQEIGILN
jgi:hypothetical protein